MELYDLDDAIERWMRERPTPAAPTDFTIAVMGRVRQERWQAERYWDLAFNAAVAAGFLLIIVGAIGLVYRSGFAVVARDVFLLLATSLTLTADQVAPMLPAYVGGFLLTASALGLWWWAEN
jgi:hypothetical protein